MNALVRLLSFFALCLAGGVALAAEEIKPPSEETPYVQTPQPVVDAMLSLAGVRATDFLIDLGSGDGRIVVTAATRFGVRGFGVDYDPRLVKLATENAKKAGVDDRVRFVQEDLFKTDLHQATVITMYLLPEYNLNLRGRFLQQLRPGTRIVSHDYGMGEWQPDLSIDVPAPGKPVGLRQESKVLFWIVPAHFGGKWRMRVPSGGAWKDAVIDIDQRFQEFSGKVEMGGKSIELERPFLRGDYVSFRFQNGKSMVRFQGKVKEGRIVGQAATEDGKEYRWRALRLGAGS